MHSPCLLAGNTGAATGGCRVRCSKRNGQRRLAATSDSTTRVLHPELTEEEQKTFQALCLSLLRQGGKVAQVWTASGGPGSISFNQFKDLLLEVKVECNDADAKKVFNLLDSEGSGIIQVQHMMRNLRKSSVISDMYSESINNTLLTLIPTGLLAVGITVFKGTSSGIDFLTAYVVEDTLSVDNMFVFLIIFNYFKVPPNLQKGVLDLGIYGAIILRGVFIYLGLAAVNSFKPVLLFFAVFLLSASFNILFSAEAEGEEEEEPPELIKSLVDALPTTGSFVGDKLFVAGDSGRWLATPLLLCIISIELSDILFAVDSVPAVFAVTDDPLIVFTSNIAAILGLRSLYQLLSIAAQDLVYLEKTAAIILGFVGVKLVADVSGAEIDSTVSLSIIIAILGGGIGLSLLAKVEDDTLERSNKKKKESTIERLVECLRAWLWRAP